MKISIFLKIFFIVFISSSLLSCGGFKKVDLRKEPSNMQERARKNVKEGKGASIQSILGGGNKNTNYEFSTSNPMWRASLEILDFLPMTTVDYSGGMIISDWYTDGNKTNESIKISIRFLSNEVRSDSLKIIVHKRTCQSIQNCKVLLLNNSKISQELRSTIIRKAALFEKDSKKKKKK